MDVFEGITLILEMFAAFFIIIVLLGIAYSVFYFIGMWKFYQKAGQEGWKCLIPFYNTYVLDCDMAGLKWYYFVIPLAGTVIAAIPIIGGLVFSVACIICSINVAKNLSIKLGKDQTWMILTVLFGGITLPLLGYSNNTVWNQDAPVDPDGILSNFINKNNAGQQPMQGQPMAQQPMQPMAQQMDPMAMGQQPVQPMPQQPVQPMAQQPVQPMAQQMDPMAMGQQPVQPMPQQPVQPMVQPMDQQPVQPTGMDNTNQN